MAGRTHVLRADLSAGTIDRERVPERWRRRYLGGKGLGARYLHAELEPNVDPLGADNLLCFLVGPLSGSLPGEPRYAAVTKSPLTGCFLDSYAGGEFAARLAGSLADCLGLLVTGTSDDPVRIEIADGDGRIVPADCWGMDAVETAEFHSEAAVACVGPAGENGVRYATIASDAGEHHAGRGGAGAVMGAKGLTAVLARDAVAEPASPKLAALRADYEDRYVEDPTGRWHAAGGTVESVDFANAVGGLATEGWTRGCFEGTDAVGIDAAREAATGRENPDSDVPGDFRVETDAGETVPRGAVSMSIGAGLGIDDFDAVATIGGLCDRLGVDVISAGNAVAWLAHADEAGLIDADVPFGDPEPARGAIRLIAGVADADPSGESGSDSSDDDLDQRLPAIDPTVVETLRLGVETATERFDLEAIPTVKSMALPAYDPRVAPAMALAYATSDRGGCHRRARPIEREVFDTWDRTDRVEAVIEAQNVRSLLWSLVADDFAGEMMWRDLAGGFLRALESTADLAYPTETETLSTIGERIWTLVRLFNVREGLDRTDDRLPTMFTEPIVGGPAAGSRIDPEEYEETLDAYYRSRGWELEGIPTMATLDRLGIDPEITSENADRRESSSRNGEQ
ncbi:aldehyde ferredoxin oxidoreductase family protein [Halopenitus sp. H-Gu1]|uniref:aldehyde ferredoxin oxidoreductase family protein n=1 Tax=Halopenitus sp. H-Gu1 TaxID=3242697 RepID=UPI00359CD3F1